MAEPALLELDELDVIGICRVRDAQRCVHCTPEQRRGGKVLTGIAGGRLNYRIFMS